MAEAAAPNSSARPRSGRSPPQPPTMLTVLTQTPAFLSTNRSERYGPCGWAHPTPFRCFPGVGQIGRGAWTWACGESSAAEPSRPAPRPSAGGKGDIVEKCHTNAIRSKRRLPTYRFQIPEGSFGVADAHQAAAESLTVPWAASFGLRMLKRLTLRFSARITRDREPTFRSRNNETFALANGLRIAEHGWPQSFAVSIIRRARVDLEREHARILRQSPDKL